LRKVWAIGSLALLHAALFTVASISSSQVTSTNSIVLAKPGVCGGVDYDVPNIYSNLTKDQFSHTSALYGSGVYVSKAAQNYVASCYQGAEKGGSTTCNNFYNPIFKATVNYTDTCPFSQEMCATDAMTIDSGYLDSHDDFGINSSPSDRLRCRKKLSCAPIQMTKFATDWTDQPFMSWFPWVSTFGTVKILLNL
jgi:hypothetical protein